MRNTPQLRPLRIWHFVFYREDGTTVALHPQWSSTKVEFFIGEQDTDWELPRSGPGGTSGPGTFRYFKDKNVSAHLKFDAKKYAITPAPPVRSINDVPL